MSRFYIRVYKDGIRERTWGTGSRGSNDENLEDYLDELMGYANYYTLEPSKYQWPLLGKSIDLN